MTRTRSTQKLPIASARLARNPPHQGCGNRDPAAADDEVVEREPHHLGKIRKRGFPAVVLPVGVGREAYRRVEREVARSPGRSPAGFSGKEVLETQNGIGEKHPDQAEEEQRDGVLLPYCSFRGSTPRTR